MTLALRSAPPLGLPLGVLRPAGALLAAAFLLVACDNGSSFDNSGIGSLGSDFSKAFNQNANDQPLDASDLNLTLTPNIEPFNP